MTTTQKTLHLARGPSNGIEDAVRKGHCAHAAAADPSHRCVGTCSITPTGTELSCTLCGGESISHMPSYPESVRQHAENVLRAAGMRFDVLAADTQARVLAAASEDLCPGCFVRRPISYASYYACACATFTWTQYDGWRRNPRTTTQVST